jgi:hypothetical protein
MKRIALTFVLLLVVALAAGAVAIAAGGSSGPVDGPAIVERSLDGPGGGGGTWDTI